MKYIKKAGAPLDFVAWRRLMRDTPNEDFGNLQNPEKMNLREALLQEQGWLCAYTMRRIDSDNSHVEHIKPEWVCHLEGVGVDLDYSNLVACFPRDGMTRQCRYGAQQKDDWWDNNGTDFVSPLHPSCESKFQFDLDGSIRAVRGTGAALTTIRVLRLDHPNLTEDRRRVLQEFIYGPNGDNPLSVARASRAIPLICHREGAGSFYEFCIAIRDGLNQHIQHMNSLARKRRFARR